jgi:phosphoribosylformylglycinamidine (FGAM) synthase-like amidotransferase family enzyme
MGNAANVLVVTGNGTNCERETAHAARLAGADRVDVRMIWDLLAGEVRLQGYQLLCLPGGFLDGDDLGAAKAAAIRWRHARVGEGGRLVDQLGDFIAAGNLVLGICNGFQLLAKLGLVPATDGSRGDRGGPAQQASLGVNDSGRFEDRWVRLAVDPESPCVFTRGLKSLEVPVRHGEGKVILADPDAVATVAARHLASVRYADASGAPTEGYPANPNGSAGGIAGLCDPTGRCFGLMPHPEAFTHRTNHPRWTREPGLPEEGAGLALFRNAVDYIRG